MEEKRQTNTIRTAIFLLVVFGIAGSMYQFGKADLRDAKNEIGGQASILEDRDPFEVISLEAKSVFVWDVKKERVLFAHNAESQLPLASLTKLMTALIAAETFDDEEIVTISSDAIREEGDFGLLVGERWRPRDLINLTLVTSANDGARALADTVARSFKGEEAGFDHDSFRTFMNEKAREIGLAQTFFTNESGLDVNEAFSGSYGSARDMALLVAYILKHNPDLLDATQYDSLSVTSLSGIEHTITNTNEHLALIPGLIGSKTGFTDLAGGNLVVAFEAGPGYPIIVSILGSSIEGRFKDVENLAWAALAYLQQ